MILKYRGFGDNWCFVEGTHIVTAKVPNTFPLSEVEDGLGGVDYYKKLKDRISAETGMYNVRFIGEVLCPPFVVAVDVDGDEYAIATEAYILNDNGKTIERLT